jgi:hypothetical protein
MGYKSHLHIAIRYGYNKLGNGTIIIWVGGESVRCTTENTNRLQQSN